MKIVVETGVKDHAFSILKRFDLMRQEGKLCDFVIKVGKEKLRVHRGILAAGSDYFFAMFSHDTLENKNGVVEMKEVSMSAVGKCMDYLYTGNLETSVEELDDLFFVVDMMQLHVVRQKLSSLLMSCLNPESFLKIRCVALKYGVEELNCKCNEFAFENLDMLHESGCLSFLDFEYTSFLLSSKFLSQYGYTENAKLLVAIDWIKADIESRKDKLVALTKLLNLQNVSYSCGKYFIENEEFCRTCSEFLAMMYLSSSKDAEESWKPTLQRYSPQAVAILSFDDKCDLKQLYDFRSPELVFAKLHLPKSPVETSIRFTAVCDDKFWIYLLLDNQSVYGFNLKSLSWQKKQNMTQNHGVYLRATFLTGHIYVCGDGTMERYNIADEEWEVVESNNVCLSGCEVIAYQGHVMTIGGTWRSRISPYVNIFNTSSLLWSKFSSLRTARETPAATVINKDIYVAGGYFNDVALSSVEYYDALTCLWTVLPETISRHDEFKLHAIQNALYTVGGSDDNDIAETYDFHKEIWSVIDPLNENGKHYESVILSHSQLELLIDK